ncbi:anti-sigma factor [Arthrobacter sp. MDT1-65]
MNRRFADDLETDLSRGHALEWAELYALDAISAEERRVLEAFLEDAEPSLRSSFSERVRTCRETVTAAYATDEAEPPADLFERIVRRLPATGDTGESSGRPTLVAAGGGALGASEAGFDREALPSGHDELAARRTARASLPSRASRWVVAAAAAAVIAVGGVTIGQNLQQTTLEQQVLQASDVRTEQLPLDPGGTAVLAVSGEENAAVVTLSGVPAPAEGFVYQMWRIPADGTAPVSEGTMSGEDVAGTKVTELPEIGGFTAVAITVEPEGGSATPTLPIVAQIPLGA